ncbi:3,4-dihydroxy-2-butanone-4-phosphate synthase [bacterium AH-315-P15]|nr:3,4-dihydroxy-2-butanone-4-phosphate synthase [bacterium AH-315-P15]
MDQISTQSELTLAFGSPRERVRRAIQCLAQGGGIIVADDEARENEGDMIFPAETVTVEQMRMLIKEGSGIVCMPMSDGQIRRLGLAQMVKHNTSRMGTAFTVSIEAREGVTTGVSAADRVQTARAAIADSARSEDLARPGHMFPLRADPGGVLARQGHTEAAVELVRLAGWKPAAVLCELMNADGTMARMPRLIEFGQLQDMPVLTIEDLTGFLREQRSSAA